ncbi:MAG: hypothetical protein EOL93_13585 [Epsilonproteobacteria bacterium]|nr:hypothetical protein [Campylobacterota bacterium]
MKRLQAKRKEVLEQIKPICEAYNIEDYDYIVSETGQRETLRIYDTKIGCSCNSISAIKEELTGWIFLAVWRQRSLGAFAPQVKKAIKTYWIKE